MLASLASVGISVTNVLAVETSECMVHRRCHRALVARMPEALAATLHPEDASATLNDLREAESTLKDAVRLARRVLGSTHPTVVQMENSLQNARAILGARESGREVKIIR